MPHEKDLTIRVKIIAENEEAKAVFAAAAGSALTDAMRYLIGAAQYVLRHDWSPTAPVGTRLLALDDLHTAVDRANEILKAQSVVFSDSREKPL